MRKFRLKIESTDEYQAEYIKVGFNQASINKLLKTVHREIWTDTGKKEGIHPILSYRGKEFVWMCAWMLEEIS